MESDSWPESNNLWRLNRRVNGLSFSGCLTKENQHLKESVASAFTINHMGSYRSADFFPRIVALTLGGAIGTLCEWRKMFSKEG